MHEHWTARFSRPIIFVILALICMGGYLAFTIPVAVFPATDFPRIVVGIDNGVAPIDQMQVVVTKPIEEAMNAVPGLETVRSTTSRGSAEVSLFFNWNVDMFRTLEFVNAALARVQPLLPATAKLTANRLNFAVFPILGYSLTSDTVPQRELWELANYSLKPRLNRLSGVSMVVLQGGQVPEFHIEPDPAKMLEAQVIVTIRDGGSGRWVNASTMSFQVPGCRSCSHNTTEMRPVCKIGIASSRVWPVFSAHVKPGQSGQSEERKMALKAA